MVTGRAETRTLHRLHQLGPISNQFKNDNMLHLGQPRNLWQTLGTACLVGQQIWKGWSNSFQNRKRSDETLIVISLDIFHTVS